jgi:hypothetical protein
MIDFPAAALKIALDCHLPDTLARHVAAIMLRENPKLDAGAVHHNPNGTDDYGYTQVNTVHLDKIGTYSWLSDVIGRPITPQTILEPCLNLKAGLLIDFVRYNGNPTPKIAIEYATRAWNTALAVDRVGASAVPPGPPAPPLPPPCAPAWDAWATATCGHKIQAPAVALTEKEPMHAN